MRLCMVVAALMLVGQGVAALDLTGHYRAKGTNLDGSIYEGDAQITATSDVTCEIEWVTGGTASSGICMRNGNAFAAGYELNGKVGLVIYLIQDDGTLAGTWTVAGINGVGTEILTPE